MAKRILLLVGVMIYGLTGWSQNDKLNLLLKERENLIQQYHYYNKQNNNFWGKKSKKDLLNIIESLKPIINKDSEIIKEINVTSLKKQAITTVEKDKIERQVVDDKRVAMENFYDLKQEMASLKNIQKVKQREIETLKEKLTEAQNNKLESDKRLVIVGGLGIMLLLYCIFLKSNLVSLKKKRTRINKV